MKGMKKLIPALCLLLVSAILMGTSTYAWFSMNTQVTATGMQVKAVAEDGLLIINELDADTAANWKVTANATYGGLASLIPTSTADATAWYHNKSDLPTDAKANQASTTYEQVSGDANWKRDEGDTKTGVYYIDSDTDNTKDDVEKAYVLLNKFYIKSSGDAIALGSGNTYQALYINKVKATGSSTSANLDKSLRVAVKVGTQLFIYAPLYTDADVSYNVAGSATTTTGTHVPANYILNAATSQTSVPAINTAKASTIPVEIYIYFEGEDVNCKSENITDTLDTLNVEVVFGITKVTE